MSDELDEQLLINKEMAKTIGKYEFLIKEYRKHKNCWSIMSACEIDDLSSCCNYFIKYCREEEPNEETLIPNNYEIWFWNELFGVEK